MTESQAFGIFIFIMGVLYAFAVIFKPEWLAKGRKGKRMVGWIGMPATRVISFIAALLFMCGGVAAILGIVSGTPG